MQTQYSLDMAGKIYRAEFYELRGANLQQLLEANINSKLIKNAKNLDLNTLKWQDQKINF